MFGVFLTTDSYVTQVFNHFLVFESVTVLFQIKDGFLLVLRQGQLKVVEEATDA